MLAAGRSGLERVGFPTWSGRKSSQRLEMHSQPTSQHLHVVDIELSHQSLDLPGIL